MAPTLCYEGTDAQNRPHQGRIEELPGDSTSQCIKSFSMGEPEASKFFILTLL